jgi:hypothetical protein
MFFYFQALTDPVNGSNDCYLHASLAGEALQKCQTRKPTPLYYGEALQKFQATQTRPAPPVTATTSKPSRTLPIILTAATFMQVSLRSGQTFSIFEPDTKLRFKGPGLPEIHPQKPEIHPQKDGITPPGYQKTF